MMFVRDTEKNLASSREYRRGDTKLKTGTLLYVYFIVRTFRTGTIRQ